MNEVNREAKDTLERKPEANKWFRSTKQELAIYK